MTWWWLGYTFTVGVALGDSTTDRSSWIGELAAALLLTVCWPLILGVWVGMTFGKGIDSKP